MSGRGKRGTREKKKKKLGAPINGVRRRGKSGGNPQKAGEKSHGVELGPPGGGQREKLDSREKIRGQGIRGDTIKPTARCTTPGGSTTNGNPKWRKVKSGKNHRNANENGGGPGSKGCASWQNHGESVTVLTAGTFARGAIGRFAPKRSECHAKPQEGRGGMILGKTLG